MAEGLTRPIRAGGALVVALAAVILASPPDAPAGGSCFGETPTIVRGGGDDMVQGTQGADVIVTGGGDDYVAGGGGRDRICVGSGAGDRGDQGDHQQVPAALPRPRQVSVHGL